MEHIVAADCGYFQSIESEFARDLCGLARRRVRIGRSPKGDLRYADREPSEG